MKQQKKLIKIFILFLVSLAFYLVWYLLDGIILPVFVAVSDRFWR